jgi:hypothetical protein
LSAIDAACPVTVKTASPRPSTPTRQQFELKVALYVIVVILAWAVVIAHCSLRSLKSST